MDKQAVEESHIRPERQREEGIRLVLAMGGYHAGRQMHDAGHATTIGISIPSFRETPTGDLQKTSRENGRDPDLFPQRHLKAGNQNHRKEQDRKIRDDIDGTTRHEHPLIVQAVARDRRHPKLLPWNARPDFDGHIRDIEE